MNKGAEMVGEDGGALEGAQAQVKQACRLVETLGAHQEERLVKRRRSFVAIVQDASLSIIRGWDHQMQLAGLSLSVFAPLPTQSTQLGTGELRYRLAAPRWASYEAGPETPWTRSFIKNLQTTEKRCEVSVVETLPVLCISFDECSINLAAAQYVVKKLEFRVVWMRDAASPRPRDHDRRPRRGGTREIWCNLWRDGGRTRASCMRLPRTCTSFGAASRLSGFRCVLRLSAVRARAR